MNSFSGLSIAFALVGALGCSSSSSSTANSSSEGGSAPNVDLKGVVMQGGVTSAEASQLLAARPDDKLKPTPTFFNPAPTSEYLSTAPIPKFEWNWKDGSSDGMTEYTYLQFGAPAAPELLRVVTKGRSFEPTEDEWTKLSIGEWVTVEIFSGLFAKETMQGDAAEGDPVLFCSMPAPKK